MDVNVKEILGRRVVFLKCKGSWRQIPSMISRLEEIKVKYGIEVIGPPSGIYYNAPGEVSVEELDWEIFYPISNEYRHITDDDYDFGIKELPPVKVASAVYKGSYRKTGVMYTALHEWVKKNGFVVCGPVQEEYPFGLDDTQSEQTIEIKLEIYAKGLKCNKGK